MKFFIASDHAALPARRVVKTWLEYNSYLVEDLGVLEETSVDYPKVADILVKELKKRKKAHGILLCGTGIGVSIRANRYKGIRAAVCHNAQTAQLARAHNDANVLCFGGRVIPENEIAPILQAFVTTEFEGGRHEKRVELLDK